MHKRLRGFRFPGPGGVLLKLVCAPPRCLQEHHPGLLEDTRGRDLGGYARGQAGRRQGVARPDLGAVVRMTRSADGLFGYSR